MVDRGTNEAGDQFSGVCRSVGRLDPGDDGPPRSGQVQPADQARGGRTDHPVLDRGPEVRIQRRRMEHDVEVGPGIRPACVPGADLFPDDASGAVAAENVVRPDLVD